MALGRLNMRESDKLLPVKTEFWEAESNFDCLIVLNSSRDKSINQEDGKGNVLYKK